MLCSESDQIPACSVFFYNLRLLYWTVLWVYGLGYLNGWDIYSYLEQTTRICASTCSLRLLAFMICLRARRMVRMIAT